jgi:hypothetical protein
MSTAEMDSLDLARPDFLRRGNESRRAPFGARPHALLDRDVLSSVLLVKTTSLRLMVSKWHGDGRGPPPLAPRFDGDQYETLAVCVTLALARAVFAAAVAEKPAARFMIRSRTRVVKRHPKGDW